MKVDVFTNANGEPRLHPQPWPGGTGGTLSPEQAQTLLEALTEALASLPAK